MKSFSVYWIFMLTVLQSDKSQPLRTGLYSLDDKIEIFTVANYRMKLFNQPFAWLVEFYAHWCGHCQRFVPIWKRFALDIDKWTPFVRLAAIDCADAYNAELCREFEIDHYPSLRFFHDNFSPRDGDIGDPFMAVEDISVLRANLVKKLVDNKKGYGNSWPLEGASTLTDLVSSPRNTTYTLLIIEAVNSTLGHQLLLDFHTLKKISIKIIKDSNQTAPSLWVLDQNLSLFSLTPQRKTREDFAEAIEAFCLRNKIPIPRVIQPLYNQDFSIQKDFISNQTQIRVIPTNKVYLSDLERTLHHAFNFEIPIYRTISGDKLEALREFLRVILRYFPLTQKGRIVYSELYNQIMANETNCSGISGRTIHDFMLAFEKSYRPYSQKLDWIRCRGSTPMHRGYPCGLWTLFHTLTLAEMKVTSTSTVLKAMLGYVKHFFGCRNCSKHFQQMSAKLGLERVENPAEAVLWLWNAHNVVNQRLMAAPSDDPQFPKGIFPSRVDCPQCYDGIGIQGEILWNRNAVLLYLRQMYEKFEIFIYH